MAHPVTPKASKMMAATFKTLPLDFAFLPSHFHLSLDVNYHVSCPFFQYTLHNTPHATTLTHTSRVRQKEKRGRGSSTWKRKLRASPHSHSASLLPTLEGFMVLLFTVASSSFSSSWVLIKGERSKVTLLFLLPYFLLRD